MRQLLFVLLLLAPGCAYRSEFTVTADAEATTQAQPQARLAVAYRVTH